MARKAAVLSAGLLAAPIAMNAQNYDLRTDHPFYNVLGDGSAIPEFVDYDGDGDHDLFLFAEANSPESAATEAIQYFENTGSAFVAGTLPNFPADLGIAEILDTNSLGVDLSASIIDYDMDGDLDVFLGIDDGELRYLQNDNGTYQAIIGADNPFDGVIFDAECTPAFGDVDGDGDVDAMIGSTSGMRFFRNEAGVMTDIGSLTIDGDDDSSSPALYDYDGDGDLDLIVGNKNGELFYFENNAGDFTQILDHPLTGVTLADYANPAFADVDFDGDVDLVTGEGSGLLRVYSKGDDGYGELAFNTLGLVVGDYEEGVVPEFVDFDSDGDMDLLLGLEDGSFQYFENQNGDFQRGDDNPFGDVAAEIANANAAFIDQDDDGDLDVLVGSYGDPMIFFENDNGTYNQVDSLVNPFFKLTEESAQAPEFVDLDGDGDLDLVIGNKSGTLEYFTNDGGVYTLAASNPFESVDVGSYAKPTFIDLDDDGDMDLVVGSEDGKLSTFTNDAGVFVEKMAADNPFNDFNFEDQAAAAFTDLDGDGDVDVLVGNYLGMISFLENGAITSVDNRLDVSSETELFPNPLVNTLNIRAPWNKHEAAIDVYDNQGRRMLQRSFIGSNAQVNLSSLPVGNYHIKIHNTAHKAVRSIIKTQ